MWLLLLLLLFLQDIVVMKSAVTMIGGDVGLAVGCIILFVGMLSNNDDNVVVEEGMLGDNSNINNVNNDARAMPLRGCCYCYRYCYDIIAGR